MSFYSCSVAVQCNFYKETRDVSSTPQDAPLHRLTPSSILIRDRDKKRFLIFELMLQSRHDLSHCGTARYLVLICVAFAFASRPPLMCEQALHSLSLDHYRVFIQNQECVRHVQAEGQTMEGHLAALLADVHGLGSEFSVFQREAAELVGGHKRNRQTLKHHMQVAPASLS